MGRRISRRRVLAHALGAGAMAGLGARLALAQAPGAAPPAALGPDLREPEVRRSANGVLATDLRVAIGANAVGSHRLATRVYEGMIPGPTLRFSPGDSVRLRIRNELAPTAGAAPAGGHAHGAHGLDPNAVNMHVHGLHVSPIPPGDDVLRTIAPGETFEHRYEIPANHPPGTYWYHPHLHGNTSIHLGGGLAGAIVIEGDIDRVPEIAAARDVTMVIQELAFGADGRLDDLEQVKANSKSPARRVWALNGQETPTLRLRPGEVQRWRLINAGFQHQAKIALAGHELVQIALDGITLARPLPAAEVKLAPGNRADVLVRAGAPGVYALHRGEDTESEQVDPEHKPGPIAYVVVDGAPVSMTLPAALPAPAVLPPVADSEITNRRRVVFGRPDGGSGSMFVVDGREFDGARVDHTVELGAVEEWTVVNVSKGGHPFHIHVNPFQVVKINDRPVDPPVWRDTVLLPGNGSVTLRTRFTDFTGKFVLHCHILIHEDQGMMQLVEVVPRRRP